MIKKITLLSATLFIIASTIMNAQNSVYLNSNSEWVSEVDSEIIIYTHMFDAINDACSRAGEGAEINIKNSGTAFRRNSTAPIELDSLFKGTIKAITPLSGQTLDFRNYDYNVNSTITIHNGTDILENRLKCGIHIYKRDSITIKNLNLKGDPRYGIWARNSNKVTISDITMDLSYGSSWSNNTAGIGIRVDNQADVKKETTDDEKFMFIKNKHLKIGGNIFVNGANTHGIETFGIDTLNIGNVLVTNTGGCGVIFNNSTNCQIGVITGYKNSLNKKWKDILNDNGILVPFDEGYYATFRVANRNGTTKCKGVYSRNSGKGFSSVSKSYNCTVDYVDIKNTSSECILIDDSKNILVSGGTTSTYGLKKSGSLKDSISNSTKGNNCIKLTDFNKVITDNSENTIIINELEKGFYDIGTGGIIEKDDTRPGFGFCNTANEIGRGIEWNVNGAAGDYTFRWKFANGTSINRSALVFINEKEVITRNFYGTGGWDKWHTTSFTVYLEAGIKNIRLEANQNYGLANIDFIQVKGPGVEPSLIRFNDQTIPSNTSSKTINMESLIQENISELKIVNVKIFNLTGQLVKQVNMDLKNESLDLNNLNEGIYIKKVTTENDVEISKLYKD